MILRRIRLLAHGAIAYLRNEGAKPLIADPFLHIERDGVLYPVKKRVGPTELFYDCFLVAILTIYTEAGELSTGNDIGSFILFFTTLYSIWTQQTLFDMRYYYPDGFMWVIGYAQLCIYGAYAASAGAFDLGFDTAAELPDKPAIENWHRPHYVWKQPGEPSSAEAVLRSFFIASIVYACSRVVLIIQYLIVLYYARKRGLTNYSLSITISVLLASAFLWFVAAGLCTCQGRAVAITRITLWAAGLLAEFANCFHSMTTTRAHAVDLAYYYDRLQSLTLIVMGEGIIGAFASFRKALIGLNVRPGPGDTQTIAGIVLSAVGIFRLLFYFYFSHITHDVRPNRWLHGVWAIMHYPLHLSLLLLTQCISACVDTVSVGMMSKALGASFESVRVTLDETHWHTNTTDILSIAKALLDSPSAVDMQLITTGFEFDWLSSMTNILTLTRHNTTALGESVVGQYFTALSALFAEYDFNPSSEAYELLDVALEKAKGGNLPHTIFAEYADELFRPVYISMMGALTLLGGFFVALAGLHFLQTDSTSCSRIKVLPSAVWFRLLAGCALLSLTLLDIGHFYSARPPKHVSIGTNVAPIYLLLSTNWLLPLLFIACLVVAISDFIIFVSRDSTADEGVDKAPIASSEVAAVDSKETVARPDSEEVDWCHQNHR